MVVHTWWFLVYTLQFSHAGVFSAPGSLVHVLLVLRVHTI